MDKILTIIVPTYNMESYLPFCLSSLLVGKLMDSLDVVIINDGSKDSSSIIAHQYSFSYPNTFRVIDKENGNYGSCVNRGLIEAKGKYVKILDADDRFDTKSLQIIMEILLEIDVDLVLTDYVKVNMKNKEIERTRYDVQKNKILDFQLMSCFPEMHGVMYKTDNLRRINYRQTEGISYTDQEWIFEPMISVKSFCYIPRVLYRYLVGREGQTMDPKVYAKSLRPEIQITKSMIRLWNDKGVKLDDSHRKYLHDKLVKRIKELYFLNLILLRQTEDSLLIELDEYIKNNANDIFFDTGENCTLSPHIKLKFIKHWRRHSYSLAYFPYGIYKKIKLILR